MSKLFLLVMAVSLSTALGEDKTDKSAATAKSSDTPLMISFTDLKWTELPERKGMQFAVLSGDPKTGEYTQIRKVPAGTDNPLHSHSSELKNVIISGVWYTGPDTASARDFGPGSVVMMPANGLHVSGCRPGSDCVFYQEARESLISCRPRERTPTSSPPGLIRGSGKYNLPSFGRTS